MPRTFDTRTHRMPPRIEVARLVIDAPQPGIKAWFARTPLWKLAVWGVLAGFALPWAIIILPVLVGGLVTPLMHAHPY